MTAAAVIASLDSHLAAHGRTVTLRRVGSPNVDVSLKAHDRQTDTMAMIGDREVSVKRLVLSPTGIGTWPGALAQSDGTEVKIPRKNDQVIIGGRVHTVIDHGSGFYVANTLVRVEIMVSG